MSTLMIGSRRSGRRMPQAGRKAPPARKNFSRSQRKAQLKQRIVNAALKLFQRKGFDGTTTKQIARLAGIAEGTVFNYFRTKEEIALYFFDQEVDHAIAAVRN